MFTAGRRVVLHCAWTAHDAIKEHISSGQESQDMFSCPRRLPRKAQFTLTCGHIIGGSRCTVETQRCDRYAFPLTPSHTGRPQPTLLSTTAFIVDVNGRDGGSPMISPLGDPNGTQIPHVLIADYLILGTLSGRRVLLSPSKGVSSVYMPAFKRGRCTLLRLQ
jgi:hypothetical protein